MKKSLIYSLILLFGCSLSGNAFMTSEDYFNEEYLINHGYSKEMVRLMELQHYQINGQEVPFDKNTKVYRPWQNGVRRFLMYLDPALDDEKFMQHDTKYTNRWDSL